MITFATSLLITSVIGIIIGGTCMIVERTPLKEKLENMFKDNEEDVL